MVKHTSDEKIILGYAKKLPYMVSDGSNKLYTKEFRSHIWEAIQAGNIRKIFVIENTDGYRQLPCSFININVSETAKKAGISETRLSEILGFYQLTEENLEDEPDLFNDTYISQEITDKNEILEYLDKTNEYHG